MSKIKGILQKLNESTAGDRAREHHEEVMKTLAPQSVSEEIPPLDEGWKSVTLSMSDLVDINVAAKSGKKGKAKITPALYQKLKKRYFKGEGTITSEEKAVQVQWIQIHGKKRKMLIKPAGDYFQVTTDNRKPLYFQESVEDQPLEEGIYDPYILKAVFLGGGGGSGKGFISNLLFGTVSDMATTTYGIKSVNSDDVITALTGNLPQQGPANGRFPKKITHQGLGGRDYEELDQEYFDSEPGKQTRKLGKRLIQARQRNFIEGRLGLIIDGTAASASKIIAAKKGLEEKGYDCSMVLVNTDLEIALQRNLSRRRKVPEEALRAAHAGIQKSLPTYRRIFGDYTLLDRGTFKSFKAPGMVEVMNNEILKGSELRAFSNMLWKIAKRILEAPLKNPAGWEWLEDQTAHLSPNDTSKVTWLGKKRGR